MKSFRIAIFASILGSTALAPGWAASEGSWENKGNPKGCVTTNDALVVPVSPSHRLDAISRLELSAAVLLNTQDVVTILGLEANSSMASPQGRIESEILRLREQRRLELEEHQGSWGASFQDELDQLETLAKSRTTRRLRPYLARAVARNEYGHFYVGLCGSVLEVVNGSLGRGPMPPLIKTPVVVFLERAPTSVLATALQAE